VRRPRLTGCRQLDPGAESEHEKALDQRRGQAGRHGKGNFTIRSAGVDHPHYGDDSALRIAPGSKQGRRIVEPLDILRELSLQKPAPVSARDSYDFEHWFTFSNLSGTAFAKRRSRKA
jgi:hypothetical protein